MIPRPPFIHETPREALLDCVQRSVTLQGTSPSPALTRPLTRTFEICYPGNADALLDHPATHAAFSKDEYMPYWADLWPSAQMLGQALLGAAAGVSGQPLRALEIGCGVGLPGIVALSLGMRVIFSDYDRAALDFAERNALANGFCGEQFELLPLDWRSPPADLRVDLLLASDVIYEQRNIDPLIALIQTVVLPGGSCWLVDPNRPFQAVFEQALALENLAFEKVPTQLVEAKGKTVAGNLFIIRV